MNLEDDILIERFLRDNLSEEEKSEFLDRINKDEVFREHFLLEKQLSESLNDKDWSFVENIGSKEVEEYRKVFQSEEAISLDKTLSEVKSKIKKEGKTKNRKLFYFSGIAATILLVISLGVLRTTNHNSEDFYTDYIMLSELPSFTNRGGNGAEVKPLISAENYFKDKQYTKALEALNKVSDSELKDGNYYVYKAVSLMEINKYDEAEQVLNELKSSELIDAPKGYWYKALLYIKMNQIPKAKEELKVLVSESNYKKKEAQELLDKLN